MAYAIFRRVSSRRPQEDFYVNQILTGNSTIIHCVFECPLRKSVMEKNFLYDFHTRTPTDLCLDHYGRMGVETIASDLLTMTLRLVGSNAGTWDLTFHFLWSLIPKSFEHIRSVLRSSLRCVCAIQKGDRTRFFQVFPLCVTKIRTDYSVKSFLKAMSCCSSVVIGFVCCFWSFLMHLTWNHVGFTTRALAWTVLSTKLLSLSDGHVVALTVLHYWDFSAHMGS